MLLAFSDAIVRDALWRRLHDAFGYGDVLITMGTGKLTPKEEEGMGLVGEHDYAVIDVKEDDGQHLFLMKNPWSKGTIWKGHALQCAQPGRKSEGQEDQIIGSTQAFKNLNGIFWMGLNDIFQSFESIYLNWNPLLFSDRQDVHFEWDLYSCSSTEGSFVSNPQYTVFSPVGGTMWLLLSRHFTSKQQALNKDRRSCSPTVDEPGFISLYAFKDDGKRVLQSNGAIVRSPYVDSPNALLKMDLPAEVAFTIVVSEQGLPRSRNTFSLTAFSLARCTLTRAPEKYSNQKTLDGEWTTATSGGNANSLYYHINPQFRLRLIEESDLALLLETCTENLSVHIKLLWSKGKQIKTVASRDVLCDSGEYRKGFAIATVSAVLAGDYTVVCSTFEQGQQGSFTLRVLSMTVCDVRPVDREGAGRFTGKAQPAVFRSGIARLLAPMLSQRLNRTSISAQSLGISPIVGTRTFSLLRLSLEYGQGPSKEVLACSSEGTYEDGRASVQILDIDIRPNMCDSRGLWVVVERLANTELQTDEYVSVDFVSDEPLVLSAWGIGDG